MLLFVLISGAVNLFFWVYIFSKLSAYQQKNELIPDGHRQIVLVVRNELHNLKKNLIPILNQEGKPFDLLVIDDGSADGTFEWLQDIQNSFPDLIVKRFSAHQGKKMALHQSRFELNAEYLLFTDGDCACVSTQWLKRMMTCFREGKEIVLGYAPLNSNNNFISVFARYETFLAALQYLSYALAGIPYMGVGRNLAYHSALIPKNDGFPRHLDLLSGDDDLFVNALAHKRNVSIQIHPDSFMYSDPPRTLRAFLRQKSRHISTSVRYRTIHQILLGLFSGTHILFYCFLFFVDPMAGLGIWAFRILVILLFNHRAFVKLKASDLIWYFPLLDFLMFIYYALMSFSIIFPNKKKW